MGRRFGAVWLPLMLSAGPAFAHAPVPGVRGFYVGLLHPFSTPAQALLMLGLGLLVGHLALPTAGRQLVLFFVAAIAGLVAGQGTGALDLLMFGAAFAASATAALLPGRLVPLVALLVALGGFCIGAVSVPDPGPAADRLFVMSGSIVGATVGLLFLVGIVDVIRDRYNWPWVGIALRIAAAWVAAIALLMLALGVAGAPAG
ncbi:hypothetical protein [Oceanomicrobium pacificus]|uniref:HupE/UreJ family protein n=1 Tax=Oceanomicrobium pacificus TaxID=2692916 RepID=A0A6B0TWC8_9RHOB|nr:hypothetical protein [Oceanomicrobium pacificus]MXU66045.1 hypothetical protein [Oceanomicrobium pacificus]